MLFLILLGKKSAKIQVKCELLCSNCIRLLVQLMREYQENSSIVFETAVLIEHNSWLWYDCFVHLSGPVYRHAVLPWWFARETDECHYWWASGITSQQYFRSRLSCVDVLFHFESMTTEEGIKAKHFVGLTNGFLLLFLLSRTFFFSETCILRFHC